MCKVNGRSLGEKASNETLGRIIVCPRPIITEGEGECREGEGEEGVNVKVSNIGLSQPADYFHHLIPPETQAIDCSRAVWIY